MSTQPARVVHVRDHVPGAVYIGRTHLRSRLPASAFANPFAIGPTWGNRADVVELYRDYLTRGAGRPLLAELPALRGKPLACWCRRDGEPREAWNACHGDVLVCLLERFTDEELRELATTPAATARAAVAAMAERT